MTFESNVFAGNPLDRVSNERRDPEWLAATLAHPEARYLAFRNLEVLAATRSPVELAWRSAEQLADIETPRPILLGLIEGVPHLAVDVSEADEQPLSRLAGDASFVEARGTAAELSVAEAGVLAQARSLIDWHGRHRFCAACGGTTTPRAGGGARRCDACQAEHFPRVDPVVIVLVTLGDHALLASPRARGGTMFTCVAGFVEPGETIEEAVRREVLEETGVAVGAVRYHSSQPWPFPSSLMIGCHAEATSTEIEVDLEEIADAHWFERADVARAVEASGAAWGPADGDATLSVPPPMTISHQLIRAWALPPAA